MNLKTRMRDGRDVISEMSLALHSIRQRRFAKNFVLRGLNPTWNALLEKYKEAAMVIPLCATTETMSSINSDVLDLAVSVPLIMQSFYYQPFGISYRTADRRVLTLLGTIAAMYDGGYDSSNCEFLSIDVAELVSHPSSFPKTSPLVDLICQCMTRLWSLLPPERAEAFLSAFRRLDKVQRDSMYQKRTNIAYGRLIEICEEKGALAMELLKAACHGQEFPDTRQYVRLFGLFFQVAIDDVADMEADAANGILTPALANVSTPISFIHYCEGHLNSLLECVARLDRCRGRRRSVAQRIVRLFASGMTMFVFSASKLGNNELSAGCFGQEIGNKRCDFINAYRKIRDTAMDYYGNVFLIEV